MKRNVILAAAAVTLTLGAAVPLVASAAQAGTTANRPSIVDQIATKFNLNKADVEKVFDDNRSERQTERLQDREARLATLVKDGKITQAQSDQIQAKQTEMMTFADSLDGKTRAERRATMDAKHDELVQWAKANGIDSKDLMTGRDGDMGQRGHHGMMHDAGAN